MNIYKAALTAAASWALLGGPAAAETLDEVIAAAAEEGTVAMNTSTTRFTAASAKGLSEAISAKFGIDLTVEFVNSSPVPVTAGLVIEETKAGITPSFDVFPLPLSFTKAIDEGGAIEDVDWAGIGVS